MNAARHLLASAVVLGGSFLAADTTNALIAAALPLAEHSDPEPARRALPVVTRSLDYYLGPIVRRNVFAHGEPVPGEETVAAAVVEAQEECTLPVEVLGSVVVPHDETLSIVSVRDPATKKISVLQVGDRIDAGGASGTLAAVTAPFDDASMRKRTVALFDREDGRREACKSGERPSRTGAVAVSAAGPTGEGITRVADGQYEIPRAEIDAVLDGGLATVATTVRIVPYFEGGKSSGFKIYSIKPGSILSKLGLLNGDVLKRVNGYEITSPEKALEVYGMLKSERNLALDVTRGGKPKTLSYAIR